MPLLPKLGAAPTCGPPRSLGLKSAPPLGSPSAAPAFTAAALCAALLGCRGAPCFPFGALLGRCACFACCVRCAAGAWHALALLDSPIMPVPAPADSASLVTGTCASGAKSSGLWLLRCLALQEAALPGDGARAFLPLRLPHGLQALAKGQKQPRQNNQSFDPLL